ncbi:MAG: hypothetical protein GJ671_10035 [Alteromonadaceae bacterium]|nr:hypothetical protein [Alteromonadaceae bacterium]
MYRIAFVSLLLWFGTVHAQTDKNYIVVTNIESDLALTQMLLQRIFTGQ